MDCEKMAGDPKQWMAWLPELMKASTTVPLELPAQWVRDPQETHIVHPLTNNMVW